MPRRRRVPRVRVQVPIGKGSIDWVKTFATAKAGGVKNYFVEQTMELTRESIAALKAMKGVSQQLSEPHMKRMLAGEPTLVSGPTGDSRPLFWSMLKTASVPDC